jgi:hypothetical protein
VTVAGQLVGSNPTFEPLATPKVWELGPLQHLAIQFRARYTSLDDPRLVSLLPANLRPAYEQKTIRLAMILEGRHVLSSLMPCIHLAL